MASNVVTQGETLLSAVEGFVDDPLGFVLFAFPWGSGELAGETGPDKWQIDILQLIGDKCLTRGPAIQIAVRSGHGIGKTALIAWIILWYMSTRPHPQVVVTANTAAQLDTKTWRELAKWHKQAINNHWFTWTATKFYLTEHPETWFAAAIPWSKARAQAFAGTHERHVLLLFDEASEIEEIIWETADGSMSTSGAMWICFGNPTKNSGRFAECFKKFRHRWITREIDSRTAKMANQEQIAKWIADYGADSDFVRVRVKGMEPRGGTIQFVDGDTVQRAMARRILDAACLHAAMVIGVDVARFGDDQSVICVRQGLKVLQLKAYRQLDTMQLASFVAQTSDQVRADAVFIDVGAMGAGVIDRLRQLKYRVTEVSFGGKALDDRHYHNKRCEMWGLLREWLPMGDIPEDNELRDDLTAPEYGFDNQERIQLESKEDMKSRGIASPDKGDALALTFSYPVRNRASSIAAYKNKPCVEIGDGSLNW